MHYQQVDLTTSLIFVQDYVVSMKIQRIILSYMEFLAGMQSRIRLWSRKEPEFFGWRRSRIPKNTANRIWSRVEFFYLTLSL